VRTPPIAAIIGAGSSELTADFLHEVLQCPSLRGIDIRLMDIDPQRLDFMLGYAKRAAAERGDFFMVSATGDPGNALDGADFVLCAADVGGWRMRKLDLQIPLAHGIVHVKGDTTGPAGIFRALRGAPFIVDLCRRMERVCPRAVLVNFANPLTPLTRAALRETTITALGICSCVEDMRADIAGKMGLNARRMSLECLGVNHFTWMTGISCDGRDAMRLFTEKALPVFLADLPVTNDLYLRYGSFPVPGYKYASEFFPWYLGAQTDHGRKLGFLPDSTEERQLAARMLSQTPLEHRARNAAAAAACTLMESFIDGRLAVLHLDTPNEGRVPGVPWDAVVEGPVLVAGNRLSPLCCGALPPAVTQVLQRVTREQELTVEAAVRGDRDRLLEALLLDPLVPTASAARSVMNELLAAEKEFLPLFRNGGSR
jgi:alpha-galactosidase